MPSTSIFHHPIGSLLLSVNQIVANPNVTTLISALERYKTLLLRLIINQAPYISSKIILLGEISWNSQTKKIEILPSVNVYNNQSALSTAHITYPVLISDGYFYFDFALANNSEVIVASHVYTFYEFTSPYQNISKKLQVNFGADKMAAMQLDFQLGISKDRLQCIEEERYRLKKLQPQQFSSVQIGVNNEKWVHCLPSFVTEYQNLFSSEVQFNAITCNSPSGDVFPTYCLFFNKK